MNGLASLKQYKQEKLSHIAPLENKARGELPSGHELYYCAW